MLFSFDEEKMLDRYGLIQGVGLPGGKTLWWPEWLFDDLLIAVAILLSLPCVLYVAALAVSAAAYVFGKGVIS